MPQISLPDKKLREISERIQDAADDSHLPEEIRERLAEAGDRIAEAADRIADAGGRVGSEVGDRLSDMKWPGLAAALRAMPDVKLPNLSAPKVDTRDLRKAVSKMELPQVHIGKQPSGPPVVPLVVLAAVGGVFVGWWLATSAYTQERVRSVVQQVRSRVGLANDWDENVEERTEDFWGDERGWETNQNPGGAAATGDDDARPSSAWAGTSGPSGSISGEDGSLRGGASATAGDANEDGTAGWPTTAWSEADPGETVGSTYGGSSGSSTGGTGYDPDATR